MKTLERHNVKAYLDLIQKLLSCPQEEEWILLRKHRELVNLELMGVMEQVANHLAASGDIKAATYLHNWAGKLHHILIKNAPINENGNDRAQDYNELIQALLSCPKGEELAVLTAHQDLIDPELIRVMNQVASQMVGRDPETANYLSTLAADLDRTWIEHHEFKPTYKKEIAPDPWLDEDGSTPDLSITKNNLNKTPDRSPENAARKSEKPPKLLTQSPIKQDESLEQLLINIAKSLLNLETILATRIQPQNPLWYMEILEKVQAADWILSTDEVEKLIGVKPNCHHDETFFARGSWIFTKTGKIGAQIGWKVSKKS